ncbi:MAG: hypothetical protein WBB73_11140 [Candidatus Aminicenantaceae bacterium]
MADYEKLGAFYLGKIFDREQGHTRDEWLLYDSKDLTTHAVCVGMTGSGKTGLGIGLLEEAAIDGIPALVIDPKGDMGNLMLTFPELQSADFLPWIDPDVAVRKGMTTAELARATAETWRKGLAEWDQDPARIARFKQAAEVNIYTPGGTAGRQLRVLRSFAAPSAQLAEDPDGLRDRVQSTVSGLLALLGIAADPIRSREHILLANILNTAWEEGRSLDIAALINEIQTPPFAQVGVFDLESFYPSKERFELAISLNNLLASPGFSTWMEGQPLDIGSLLYTPQGKPCISILSIAHLSDSERMFFVTLLLNELVAWMRTQPGTTSLRALLYMDEIFGYFPPTAAPPSKKPMLTLLKQARAYGLGVVLATQNPVDLDYKGLANAGTWFIGRLQTDRDKQRVLDGLEGASQSTGTAFDRQEIDKTLSGLGKRVFLMHNVHEDRPELFQTRWVLSFLRGPLTRTQIKILMQDQKIETEPTPQSALTKPPTKTVSKELRKKQEAQPTIPSQVAQFYLPRQGALSSTDSLIYRPALLGTGRLHFVNTRAGIDQWVSLDLLSSLSGVDLAVPWEEADVVALDRNALDRVAPTDARFATLSGSATKANSYSRWGKSLADFLYQKHTLRILESPEYKQFSAVDEKEGDFRGRLAHLQHEKRDLAIEKLRKQYSPKLASLEERLRKAQVRVGKEKSQYGQQKMQAAISVGATLLGALFGRKTLSTGTVGRATTSMRGFGRAAREKEDIALAMQEAKVLQDRLADLEQQFQTKATTVQGDFEPEDIVLREILIRPRKTDIMVGGLALVWTPWRVSQDGIAEPLFTL